MATRRDLLKGSAAIGLGAAVGSQQTAQAATGDALFAHDITTIPVIGSDKPFAVRRIYCVGRNYAAHSREMGSDPNRGPPFFFQKPTDAIQIVMPDQTVDHPYPPKTKNYHYEIDWSQRSARAARTSRPTRRSTSSTAMRSAST